MPNDLRVLRIVLIPRVVERLARARDGERRHEVQATPGLRQRVRHGSMVIAGRLKGDLTRVRRCAEYGDQTLEVRLGIRDPNDAALAVRKLHQNLMCELCDIDSYPHCR